MAWRRTVGCVVLVLAVFFAGFVAGSPDYNGGCNDSHSEYSSTENAGKSNCGSPKWYTAFKRPDGWLVIVGIITFIVIGWQSLETKRSAEAAKASANASWMNAKSFAEANRPWLLIPMGDEFSDIGIPLLPEAGDDRVCHVTFRLKNFGQSPARITRQKVRLYIGDSEKFTPIWQPFSETGSYREDYAIAQTTEHPIQAHLEPNDRLSVDDRKRILEGTRYLWLCGFIWYRNASDPDDTAAPYETRICYLWMNRTSRPTPFWVMRGRREDNRAT